MNEPPFIKQMLCGVHTEDGFVIVTSSVLQNESVLSFNMCTGKSTIPSEVINLLKFSRSLNYQN